MDKNWKVLRDILPGDGADKRRWESMFVPLNTIRNAVMHPVKRVQFSVENFEFFEEARQLLAKLDKWRAGAGT